MDHLKNKMGIVLTIGAVLFAGACAEEREYDTLLKEDVLDKSLISAKEYLYLPSTVETPRNNNDMLPNYQGDGKIVRAEVAEDFLEIYQLDVEDSFQDNPTNVKPVVRIPIEHFDYRCRENSFGECSNEEEENDDLTWDQKRFFKPDFTDVEVDGIQFMPEVLSATYRNCYDELDTKLVDYTIEEGVINFQLEKTYRVKSIRCWSDIEFNTFEELLDGLTFKVRHFHSMVELDRLASDDYETIVYPEDDYDRFGFFETENVNISVDGRYEEKGDVDFLNRFNPKKGVIDYYMTENYNKPENKALKEVTYRGFEIVNDALRRAGTDMRLRLNEPNKDVRPGDVRYNMVMLVEDPLVNGTAGYGPSVKDPRTGEIVSARSVMYSGAIKNFLYHSYDSALKELLEEEAERRARERLGDGAAEAGIENPVGVPSVFGFENAHESHISKLRIGRALPNLKDIEEERFKVETPYLESHQISDSVRALHKQAERRLKENPKQGLFDLMEAAERGETHVFEERIAAMSKANMYPIELLNYSSSIKAGVRARFRDVREIKPWKDLSRDQREEMIDTLLPIVFLPTLIHELGHNLGLRHNFSGSEDSRNFYTEEERKELGIEEPFTFSTVMDYPYNNLNRATVMGKYDVAAFKFAYARKVDVVDRRSGEFIETVDVKGVLDDMDLKLRAKGHTLKPYDFCSDEGVALNVTCNRFDEGTNVEEITQHWIRFYGDQYNRRNFRNGRYDFSLNNEYGYAGYVNFLFRNIRKSMERYESFQDLAPVAAKSYNRLCQDDPEFYADLKPICDQGFTPDLVWRLDPFFARTQNAALMAADFFLSVLITPEQYCLLSPHKDPTAALDDIASLQVRPLSSFGATRLTYSCDSDEVAETASRAGLHYVGSGGKAFNSLKSPDNENIYVDQIDTRGIWVDKLTAMEYLFKREIDSVVFDRGTRNILDFAGASGVLGRFLQNVIVDRVSSQEVQFTMVDRTPVRLSFSHSFDDSHQIKVPLSGSVARRFETKDANEDFVRKAIGLIQKYAMDPEHRLTALPFINQFGYHTELKTAVPNMKGKHLAGKSYFASPENAVAFALIGLAEDRELMDSVPPALILQAIQELKDEGQPTTEVEVKCSLEERCIPGLIALAQLTKEEFWTELAKTLEIPKGVFDNLYAKTFSVWERHEVPKPFLMIKASSTRALKALADAQAAASPEALNKALDRLERFASLNKKVQETFDRIMLTAAIVEANRPKERTVVDDLKELGLQKLELYAAGNFIEMETIIGRLDKLYPLYH